jgi:hypothetical protein
MPRAAATPSAQLAAEQACGVNIPTEIDRGDQHEPAFGAGDR